MIRDLIVSGGVYSRLTAIKVAHKRGRVPMWLCRCECGGEVITSVYNILTGTTRSCGCLQKERTAKAKTTHGGTGTAEYRIWSHIIGRCHNKSDNNYARYGGRGIRVCDRWRGSFPNFLSDVGRRPSPKHELDRIDNDGHYEPGNIRWATKVQQNRNRGNNRVVIWNGRPLTLAELAERECVPYKKLHARISRGDSLERAIRK